MESFGVLLRRHRTAAVMTQERLAERARISATGIAALEAGRRKVPRPSTVALLLDALDLDEADRAEMIAAATSAASPATAEAAGPTSPGRVTVRDAAWISRWIDQRFPLVGRTVELRSLTVAFEQRRRIVTIIGEAGAGKTRLAGEFTLSLPSDVTVLWGRCTADRLGAYEPFVDPVRTLVTTTVGSNSNIGELARLVPEVAIDQGWTAGPSQAEPEVERRLLFNAIVALLTPLGRTVVVIDDLQWADSASMALLTHLVASPALDHVTVVATVRSSDQSVANAGALADMRRFSQVERIELTGLADDDLATLVGHISGGTAAPGLVATVAAATDGNPLFVEELTEHLLAHQSGDSPSRSLVPVTVRETIARRVDELPTDTQALLRAGAVLGRSFEIDTAGYLADLDGGTLLGAVEDTLLSGLVNEPSPTRLSFSHALVQSAVYELMSSRRRLDLHRRAATLLEHSMDTVTGTDAVVFDIARHWSITADADSTAAPAAARWAVRAGDAAAAAADIDEAIVRYEQADRLWADNTRDHATTLIRLGRALSAIGKNDAADQRFRAARHVAEGLGDVELYAQAAIGLAATVRYGHSDPERIAALEHAIVTLDPDDAVLRPTAAAMLKRQLGFDPSDTAWTRRQWAVQIVSDAVTAEDPPRELLLSLGAARDSIVVDDPVVLGRLSRQIIAAASAPTNLHVLANAWYGQAWSTLELADGAGWNEAVEAFNTIADELGLPFERALAETMVTTTALIEGRYEEAEERSQLALKLGNEAADPNASAVHLTGAVMRGLDLGHSLAMVELMDTMRDELSAVPTFWGGFAITAAEAGCDDLTRQIFADFASTGFEHVRRDLEWLPVIGFFAYACGKIADTEHAPQLYSMLAENPARAVRVGPLAGWWGPKDYHLGVLSKVLGRIDEAERHLRDALRITLDLGARPWQARTQIELARVLDLSGGSGTHPESRQLHESAAEIATDLEAPGLAALL